MKHARLSLKDRRTIARKTKRHANGQNTNLISEAATALKERNPSKALKLLEETLQTPNLNAYFLAIECCSELKNVSLAERLFARGIKLGLNEITLKTKLLEVYFRTKNYDKVLEIYSELKTKIVLQSKFYALMIRFFGERNNIEEVNKLLERAKKFILDPKDLEFVELEYFRIVIGSLSPGRILSYYFHNKNNLNDKQIRILLGFLYEKKAYDLVVNIYNELPENFKQNKSIKKLMLQALIKINKIKAIDLLKKLIEEETNPEEYQILLANALAGNRQIIEAQRLFELILHNITIKSPFYGSALAGYIFTNPELTEKEINKFKKDLQFLIANTRMPRLVRDLQNALDLLS